MYTYFKHHWSVCWCIGHKTMQGSQRRLYICNFEVESLEFIALGGRHTDITAHTVTMTPRVLAADAGLSRWTVIDGGMYHPPSHCLWHTALMECAVAQAK